MTGPFKSDTLRILSERGFINQCTDLDGLDLHLSVRPATIYCGWDPTAASLHAGSLLTIIMLYWFQQTGHKPLTLMGGATGLIGDPSFKDEARPLMSEATIQENIAGIKRAFGPILDYDNGDNRAIMVNNADWLKELGYLEFLRDYGPHFSVNRMLSFDSVKLRLSREQHFSFLEFNYMLMQAYDFVELYKRYDCTVQIGGSDQWGNIINGVELGRRKERVTLHAMTTNLLTTASGKKMGKSEGNAVWLNRDMLSDYDFYQYWRNTEDDDVIKFLKLFTALPMDEIMKLAQLKDSEINEAKKILAFEATKMVRGDTAALQAQQTAQQTFAGTGKGNGLPRFTLMPDDRYSIVDLLVQAQMATSKGEAKRLIAGKGVRLNDMVISDDTYQIDLANDFDADGDLKLSAGKKRHALFQKTDAQNS